MVVADARSGSSARTLRDAVAAVLAEDVPAVRRLAHAGTVVRFGVQGDDAGVTLDLTGDRPSVDAAARPEISVTVTADDARALASGATTLLRLLAAGRAGAEGPIRRYLEVEPILTGLLSAGGPRVGHDAEPASAPAATGPLAPELLAIQTRGLKKAFGRSQILDGLDVAIPEGTVSVVLGPSGTGKSVLLKHITGLLRPDAGDVLVRGRSLGAMSASEALALRCEVGVMFQDGALFSNMSVFDNVAFPLREHTDLDDREVEEVVMDRLGDVGMAQASDRMPAQLSGGMKKRVGLARALVLDPGIVLVDEPDSGLDPVRTALLGELLVEQHAANGGTMVVVTHNIALARYIASHVSVLWKGRVVIDGFADDVFSSDDPLVRQFIERDVNGPLGMD